VTPTVALRYCYPGTLPQAVTLLRSSWSPERLWRPGTLLLLLCLRRLRRRRYALLALLLSSLLLPPLMVRKNL
jgi:hypothetical protein